jgi:beta-phosphoglucomutase-like phosphatase (HAD superfamily)
MKNLIKGVIYDMDGLIINSEPLWKIAIIESFKEIGFDFTFEMCTQTTGMRIDEVVKCVVEQLILNRMLQDQMGGLKMKLAYLHKIIFQTK